MPSDLVIGDGVLTVEETATPDLGVAASFIMGDPEKDEPTEEVEDDLGPSDLFDAYPDEDDDFEEDEEDEDEDELYEDDGEPVEEEEE